MLVIVISVLHVIPFCCVVRAWRVKPGAVTLVVRVCVLTELTTFEQVGQPITTITLVQLHELDGARALDLTR